MRTNILFLIIGIFIGGIISGLAFYTYTTSSSSKSEPNTLIIPSLPNESPKTPLKPQTTSNNLDKEIARLKEENSKLINQLKEASKKTLPNFNRQQEQREAWTKVTSEFLNQQLESQFSALKLHLKLTDSQEATLKAILDSQKSNIQNLLAQNHLSREEIQKFTDEQKNLLEAQIKQFSTPEQLAQYEKYKTEQKQTQNEIQANNDLLRLNQQLNLSQKQQDEAFKILYQDQENRSNPLMTREQRRASTKASLQKILTPEQFTAYEQQQEARRKMWGQLRENNSSKAITGP